jgi:hypothetical protein
MITLIKINLSPRITIFPANGTFDLYSLLWIAKPIVSSESPLGADCRNAWLNLELQREKYQVCCSLV